MFVNLAKKMLFIKAVISLAGRQIRESTDDQLGTFFFGWCLRRRVFLGFFVAHAGSECAGAQIRARASSHFWVDAAHLTFI